MLMEKMKEATVSGKYRLPRKEGSFHRMNARNCVSTVAVKVSGLSGLKAEELTIAEVEGRKQAFEYERFFQREIPGFGEADIIGLSNQIGVRETRRVYGEHRLTKAECMAAEVKEDSILLCGAPIEDHRLDAKSDKETYWEYIPGKGIYGVPYGCIVPKDSDKAWVVGRCFSATHDAHASCRSMAQTMAMGQAAGIAAAQSLIADESARDVGVAVIREKLIAAGGILEIPDRVADTSKDGWGNNF